MTEVIWEGAEPLREYLVPVAELEDHSRNPRRGDVLALTASLERFGQVRPILAEDGTIVAGHHLRKAAVELGWTHIAVIPHKFEDEAARDAYLIADNYLAGLAGYDEQAQMDLLEELEARGELKGTGVTPDAIEDLRAAMSSDAITTEDEWERVSVESDEDVAARAAALAQYEQHREVPLSLTVAEFEEFGKNIRIIQGARGFTRMAEAVLYALEVAAYGAEGSVEGKAVPPKDTPAPTEPEPSVVVETDFQGEHKVRILFGDFGDDPDAAYGCKLECACGWERLAVHGEEAEKFKNEHLGAILV
jgi:hypothetical protein